jgi:hypothetical protein
MEVVLDGCHPIAAPFQFGDDLFQQYGLPAARFADYRDYGDGQNELLMDVCNSEIDRKSLVRVAYKSQEAAFEGGSLLRYGNLDLNEEGCRSAT